ncbi:YggS family pyridoxal phosphate-dependent enzyme [Collinsella tanakaei]|uniref:YggS family pyridoxal phosphate-dependent enzyme n=1 Tax=Collinsella tanakaei TaxID=626935 RepID=UPI001958548C|nr:YggS family pyridoxal phosphate-dependent enzyme [Collinsella tanakaei]MBM6868020.1 YggS family pyridoxal phosphate-dependent enzyme [Collinsella tanakaei]
MESYSDLIAERRAEIVERIDAALARAGRADEQVTLVAVSKTVGVDEVVAALGAGYRVFGENRPQELVRKLEGLAQMGDVSAYRFDMIGNLQTNKINTVLGRVALIHSIGSAHLADAVSSRAERRIAEGSLAAPAHVLLEVNVSGEASKSGFAPDEVRACMPHLMELSGIHIDGLMTMAPRGDKDAARRTFSGLRELRDELRERWGLELPELSCGMSEDFEIALEEGSTIVRLGRVVFNPSFALQ